MRKITIKVQGSQGVTTFESSANTFGELKAEAEQHGVKLNGYMVILRETRTALIMDESKLPDHDIQLFAYVEKTKSAGDRYDDMDYNAIRKYASSINLKTDGTAKQIRQRVRDAEKKSGGAAVAAKVAAKVAAPASDDASVAAIIAKVEAIKTFVDSNIDEVIDRLRNLPEGSGIDLVALNDDFELIKKRLGL